MDEVYPYHPCAPVGFVEHLGFASAIDERVEMSDAKSRPALKSKPENLADYDTIYIGFPIWWNSAPRIINTFIESGDFAGKALYLSAAGVYYRCL